ncbi:acyltransferase family protein [Tunturiibacter lichenicola]|uniref:acyltransferase family protein n=1 Tax=Tunturiibacter lichenicola TaxID=2051959 RepID=UPI003D9ADCCE
MPQLSRKYFPALDGLRTVCVSLVIFDHLGHIPYPLNKLPGWLGVDIFFLISGFLITTLLFREESVKQKVDLYAFYVRRFFRIVPLYFFVLSVYVVRALRNPRDWALMRHLLVYYLTMSMDILSAHIDVYGNYIGVNKPPFGASWSLGVEEKFYLLWPLLFFVLLPKKTRLFAVPVLMALAAFLPFRLFRSYFGLLVGCLLAIALASAKSDRVKRWWAGIPAIVVVSLVAIGFYLVNLDMRFVFLFPFLGALLLSHLLLAESWLVKLLSSSIFVWIGQRSYSMYLIHMMLIDSVEHFLPHETVMGTLIVTVLAVTVTALAADVLYRLVEGPTRQFGKRLLARSRHTSSSLNPTESKGGPLGGVAS